MDEKKEIDGAKDDSLKLIVKCNKMQEEVFFTIKRNTKIRRLLVTFCQRNDLEYRATRFVYDERVFSHDKTPHQLGMKDGDQIDALLDGNGA